MTRRLARILRALAVDADLLRRRRELRLLVFGQATSLLGSMITLVALPVRVYELTGSTVAVGLLGVAEFVPILGLALAGGADAISGVFRATIWNETIRDRLRGGWRASR